MLLTGLFYLRSLGDIDTAIVWSTRFDPWGAIQCQRDPSECYIYGQRVCQTLERHVRDTLKPSLEAYRIALETGDVSIGPRRRSTIAFKAYWSGEKLAELEHSISKYSEIADQLKQETVSNLISLHHQIVLNLPPLSQTPVD